MIDIENNTEALDFEEETEVEATEETQSNALAIALAIAGGVIATGGVGYVAYKLAGKIPFVAAKRDQRAIKRLEKLGYNVISPEVVAQVKAMQEQQNNPVENNNETEKQ